jgi:curli biogenesis system outer membrane secretion channel CsgG
MLKRLTIAISALALFSTAAIAQTAPPAAKGPQNNAINTSNTPQPDQPVAGRNSFTEGEAKSRIEAKGFTNISDLQKDDSGVWRGHATQNGRQVVVSLDYQGNVVAK